MKKSAIKEEIEVVPVEHLHRKLGFPEPILTPLQSIARDYPDFRMDRNDGPILDYLFRNFRPARHLEFGTWEGFGVRLAARACDAKIWTINLPHGENSADGGAKYQRALTAVDWRPATGAPDYVSDRGEVWRTDSGEFIGRLYREAGYADRVEQIYADSVTWNDAEFADGFFDTAFIDGGHAPDVVLSDTRKAMRLVRPGGLLIWHDFCPDLDAIRRMPATHNVVKAVLAGVQEWRDNLDLLFWIKPSFLLVGLRR